MYLCLLSIDRDLPRRTDDLVDILLFLQVLVPHVGCEH